MMEKGWQLLVVGVLCGIFVVAYGAADPFSKTGGGYIVVTVPPSADFFTSTRYGSAPFTVTFSDSSTGKEPLTYLWDFGDGSTSRQQNPTHSYQADGEYDVRLTVTNVYGQDTRTRTAYIGVGDPVEPDFSASATEGTAPLTVAFSDTSRNRPLGWAWDFGDNATSREQNPSHTYAVPGNYTVQLVASNHAGSGALAKTGYIRVTAPPPAAGPSPPEDETPEGIRGLIHAAKGPSDKDLPTAGIIPPQFMAPAAMLTSLAVLFIQFLSAHVGVLSQIGAKCAKFLADLAGGHAVGKVSDREILARGITARKVERQFFGLSATEILVIEAAVVMLALAFILADRAVLILTTVLIYMGVGAISVILHDLAHRYMVTRHGNDAEARFWGLGTFIMFLTAWLYGNAFAQSYRNLVNREREGSPRDLGIEMVAGPCVSIVLMVLFLAMSALPGLWAKAGGVGFTVNLLIAVYSLMPIDTMDGLSVWKWNRVVYTGLFVPLLLFYCYTYMIA